MNRPPLVVKVGGSLYDWPGLGPRLRQFLAALAHPNTIVVPGGGPFADAVRDVDRVHGLGEEKAHWLALRSLALAGRFLEALLDDCAGVTILDAQQFAHDDESRPGHLPHVWAATSDSLAARVARVMCAERLILLKSTDPPADWLRSDYVDPLFAEVIADANFAVEAINLRHPVR